MDGPRDRAPMNEVAYNLARQNFYGFKLPDRTERDMSPLDSLDIFAGHYRTWLKAMLWQQQKRHEIRILRPEDDSSREELYYMVWGDGHVQLNAVAQAASIAGNSLNRTEPATSNAFRALKFYDEAPVKLRELYQLMDRSSVTKRRALLLMYDLVICDMTHRWAQDGDFPLARQLAGLAATPESRQAFAWFVDALSRAVPDVQDAPDDPVYSMGLDEGLNPLEASRSSAIEVIRQIAALSEADEVLFGSGLSKVPEQKRPMHRRWPKFRLPGAKR